MIGAEVARVAVLGKKGNTIVSSGVLRQGRLFLFERGFWFRERRIPRSGNARSNTIRASSFRESKILSQ